MAAIYFYVTVYNVVELDIFAVVNTSSSLKLQDPQNCVSVSGFEKCIIKCIGEKISRIDFTIEKNAQCGIFKDVPLYVQFFLNGTLLEETAVPTSKTKKLKIDLSKF